MTPALPAPVLRHPGAVLEPCAFDRLRKPPRERSTGHLPAVPFPRPEGEPPAPLVGYLVFVPEGTDPAALLAREGLRAEVRPLTAPADADAEPPAPAPEDGVRTDRDRRTAEANGRRLDLTYLEFALLDHLVTHPHRVHTRASLVHTLWGHSHIGDGRTVDVHISRIRRKLGPAHREGIVTVRRVGYKYVPAARR